MFHSFSSDERIATIIEKTIHFLPFGVTFIGFLIFSYAVIFNNATDPLKRLFRTVFGLILIVGGLIWYAAPWWTYQ